jgi:hypothetical protein
MRARNLKPSIFKNELLAVADPLYTVIFEGLWCAADREGRLEDRPAKLHMEINPGRAFDGTDRSIAWLSDNGFILRYSVNGVRYIQILQFTKHQKPHVNEKPSVIPAPESTTKVASEHNQGTKHLALTPDSGLLTPESSLRETRARVEVSRDDAEDHAEWLTVLEAYPTGAVRSDLIGAERAARRLVESGDATWQALRDGAGRYAAVCRATDRIVMNPVKFFTDDDKPWSQAWPIPPPKKSFVQQQQDGMAERFLRGVS